MVHNIVAISSHGNALEGGILVGVIIVVLILGIWAVVEFGVKGSARKAASLTKTPTVGSTPKNKIIKKLLG